MALLDNILSYWKLDETSNYRFDSTPKGYHLTSVNGVASVAGKQGNAADIVKASNQWLLRTTNADLCLGNIDFTIAIWVRLRSKAADQIIIGKSGSNGAYQLTYKVASDRFVFQTWGLAGYTGYAEVVATSLGSPATATWYFVVVDHNATSDLISIQVNNGTTDSAAADVNGIYVGTDDFDIGTGDSSQGLDAAIDEVGIWKRRLTSTERSSLYNGGSGTTYPFGETAAPTFSYFGTVSVPADGASATNATTTITLTPPASMVVGDLTIVVCQSLASATWTNGVTGGQTWTAGTTYNGTAGPYCRIFWCTFNGTWGANPRFDSTSGTSTSAVMHVFRPDVTTRTWAIDVAQATTTFAAPSSPFTVTRAGLTTGHDNVLALACWHSVDDNTWGSLNGPSWMVPGTNQYRNTAGTDQSAAFTYYFASTTGNVIPSVSLNQLTLGGDAGVTAITAFYAIAAGLSVNLTEPMTLSEVRSGAAGFARSQADAMTLAEALAKIAAYLRSYADALTLGESVAKQLQIARALADALTLAESVIKALVLTRSASEPLTLGDALARNATFARLQTEALSLSETLTKLMTFSRTRIEPLSLAETIAKSVAFSRSFTEPISLGEALLRFITLVRSLADTIGLADAVALTLTAMARAVQDALNLVDAVAVSLVTLLSRALADPLALGEAIELLPVVSPIQPGGGGWGRVSLPRVEIQLEELSKLFGDQYTEKEQAAILAAIMWTLK